MKKNFRNSGFFLTKLPRMLIMMKTVLILLVCSLNLQAVGYSQKKKFDISMKEVPLAEVFRYLRQESGYKFVYDSDAVKQAGKVSVEVKGTGIEEVLENCLQGTPFVFMIEDGLVIIREQKNIPQKQAQEVKVTGKVMDEEGNLLPGVTVLIQGTALGTVTDASGKFVLTMPDIKEVTLVFSFVGMQKKNISWKGEKDLNITLMTEVAEMEEAVVTGIYSRKKESYTGSAETYTAKELKMTGTINVLQSLKTLDPAFNIVENNLYGSDPNHMPEININGKSSINALHSEYDNDPNAPLFILDGFETTLEVINDLSMDRIQSITLLKDAASTAIYGSKGANGVVVVETKTPTAGKLRVNYNGNFQLSWADLSDYNLMNAAEKLEFEKLSGYYGYYDDQGYFADGVDMQKYYSRLAEVKRGVDTYWMNEPLRVALTQGHTLFVEGGDNILRYSVNVSYRNTKGVMKGSDRNALNGSVNLIYRHKTLSFNNMTSFDVGNAISENATFSDFSGANPYYRKKNELGLVPMILESFAETNEYVYNPLYDMEQNSLNRTRTQTFSNRLNVEWKIQPFLSLRGRFNISRETSKKLNFASPNLTRFQSTELTDRGSYSETNGDGTSYSGDATLTFGKVLGDKHQVNAVVGMSFSSSSRNSSGFSVRGFLSDRFDNPAFSNGYPDGSKPSYTENETRSASYYFNGGYSYNNRYLLDANFRMDGASVFGVNNPFTHTWAVGIGWNVHNENFLKNNNVLSYLKLRFSIGNPGNQNLDAKKANNAYTYVTAYPNPFGLAATVSTWGNKDLEWQKTLNTNYGIDMELWNRRLRFTIDYYNKKTDPQIISINLPPSTGSGSIPENLGGLRSYGLTMSATVHIIRKENMRWSLNGNLRHSVSEYYDIGNSLSQYTNSDGNTSSQLMRFYDGATTTALYAVRSAGIDPATGREVFIKRDGSQTYTYNVNDQVKVGDSTPKVEGVIGTSFYYKGLSCNINFRYRSGGQIFMNTLYEKVENISSSQLRQNQDKRALYDRWKQPGDKAKFKSISLTESTPISSRFVEDENTFSCEGITVNYETQAKWLKVAGISSLTVGASTSDIFRISTVKNERGLSYPFQRSVNFSLGIRF